MGTLVVPISKVHTRAAMGSTLFVAVTAYTVVTRATIVTRQGLNA